MRMIAGAVLALTVASLVRADDYPERAQDETIVETVLRLENFDLNSSEKGKSAVLRYLQHNLGSERFFELLRKYELPEADAMLVDLAAEKPTDTAGVEAARTLIARGRIDRLKDAIAISEDKAASLVTAMGLSGRKEALAAIAPAVVERKRPLALRSAAAIAVGRLPGGEAHLLALVEKQELPDDLKFTVGNVLRSSADAAVRAAADKHLPLPATADAQPLPPLAELVKQSGDPTAGKIVFTTKGTCAKCHKVAGEGKEIGPDLTEIGSKLTPEAMFVAILDPSAGISHNYESYQAFLDDGTTFVGLKISETDDAVTLKSAEGIERAIPQDEIDELFKQKISLMPADLQKLMTAKELVDVVAYLQTLKKKGS